MESELRPLPLQAVDTRRGVVLAVPRGVLVSVRSLGCRDLPCGETCLLVVGVEKVGFAELNSASAYVHRARSHVQARSQGLALTTGALARALSDEEVPQRNLVSASSQISENCGRVRE